MREIKFRGKYGNNPWIYGSLVARNRNNNGIQAQNSSVAILVDDGSIGQYTGMKDSHGKEIYEGDIVKVKDRGTEAIFEIRWRQEGEPMWILYPNTIERWWCLHCIEIHGEYRDNGVTVIGNIYDNPELLGG